MFMGKGFGVVVESIFKRLFCNSKGNSDTEQWHRTVEGILGN